MNYITDENFSRPGGTEKVLITIVFPENVNQFKALVFVSKKMTNVPIGSLGCHMQIKLPHLFFTGKITSLVFISIP